MIKQLASKDIKEYLQKGKKCVLLDVRTKEEWNQDGKPDGEKLGLKTYFLSLLFQGRIVNVNFIEEFKKFNIDRDSQILTLCGSGNRSQGAAELLIKESYTCANVSDGFLGNSENIGWKNSGLPCK